MRRIGLVIALSLVAGCGETPFTADAPVEQISAAPAARRPDMDEYFVKWLKDHKHTDVVVDAVGVGIANNATRLRAGLHGSNEHQQGVVVEVEFTIVLPSGRTITEFVAGLGDTEQAAINDAFVNFTLTTVHVVYKGFINADDVHMESKMMPVNGRDREVIAGDLYLRGNVASDKVDLNALRPEILSILQNLPLSPEPHWIKLVFMQQDSKPVTVAVTLDNEDSPELTRAIQGLNWPLVEGFYMVKQFLLVR
jgi:hypothetical protein